MPGSLWTGNSSGLSFVTEHIDLDIGHTKFNAQELAKLITGFPTASQPWWQQVALH